MATPLADSALGSIADEWSFEVGYAIQRDLSKAIYKTVATGAKNHYLKEMNRIFDERRHVKQRAKAHGHVAEAMRDAVKGKVAGIKSKKPYPIPRKNRMSGGLARAVNDPSFAAGDQFGIRFVNRTVMNREARHWQRLNFGTGALQEEAIKAKPKLGGRQLLDVTVKPIAVGGGSRLDTPWIPDGMFVHGSEWIPRETGYSRTGNPFYPAGKFDFVPTADIKPRGFLNAGLRKLETELPKAYIQLVQQYGQKKNTKASINVKA